MFRYHYFYANNGTALQSIYIIQFIYICSWCPLRNTACCCGVSFINHCGRMYPRTLTFFYIYQFPAADTLPITPWRQWLHACHIRYLRGTHTHTQSHTQPRLVDASRAEATAKWARFWSVSEGPHYIKNEAPCVHHDRAAIHKLWQGRCGEFNWNIVRNVDSTEMHVKFMN